MVRRVMPGLVLVLSIILLVSGCGNPLLDIVKGIHQRETSPDIQIVHGDPAVEYGPGSQFDFGSAPVGSVVDVAFQISNRGKVELRLSGWVVIEGADAAMFSIQSQPDPVIPAGTSSSFTVRFAPTSDGLKQATLTVRSDDPNAGEYAVTLTGTGTVAQINVRQGTTNISSGGSFGMGGEEIGGWIDATFEIQNLGTGPLNLTGSPDKVQVDSAEGSFSCTSQPTSPVSPAFSVTFVIRFDASDPAGLKAATVSFPNNDADLDPYTFELTATAIQVGEPIMELARGATGIASGGSTDYGAVTVGDTLDVVFTIINSGTLPLHLTGSPYVSLSSSPAGQFSVQNQPPSGTVAASGGTTTFTVRFTPTSAGAKSATVSIANDSATNPYTFTITGTGGLPEMNLK